MLGDNRTGKEQTTRQTNGTNGTIAKGPAKILSALIQHPEGCTSSQLAQLTGYKETSRYEFLRLLKASGYAAESGDHFVATDDGRAALPDVEPLPEGHELLEWWRNRLEKGERLILEQLVEVYPDGLSSQEIEERTGYKATSVYEYRRKLVARKLVVDDGGKTKAADILFD